LTLKAKTRFRHGNADYSIATDTVWRLPCL
jgi:hypothetical protein